MLEELPHHFERIDGFLCCLSGETVHQVSMHQYPGPGEIVGNLCHLCYGDSLVDHLQDTVGGNIQPAGNRDTP